MVEHFTDPESTTRLVCVSLGLATLLNSLHSVVLRQHFRNEGAWSWDVPKASRSPVIRSGHLNRLMGYRGVWILHGMRTVAVLILVTLFGVVSARTPTIWCVFLIQVILDIHNRSSDGGDIISHIVWVALALGHILPRDPIVTETYPRFIALQGCLSYASNGWAKWRSTKL